MLRNKGKNNRHSRPPAKAQRRAGMFRFLFRFSECRECGMSRSLDSASTGFKKRNKKRQIPQVSGILESGIFSGNL